MSEAIIRELAEEAEPWTPGLDKKPLPLARGSDIEIAERVLNDVETRHGAVIFCDGEFWRYDKTHWRAINWFELRVAVHRYDGASYGDDNIIKLSKTRIDSVINEMKAKRADPAFFVKSPAGINCFSGFIRFAADGVPSLEPHDREHRCRHVIKGNWSPDDDMWKVSFGFSNLRVLLEGVFHGDEDAEQKVAFLQEIAGAVAIGYATRLRQPKAIILSGATAENGKSQVLDVLRGLLPPEAVTSIPAAKMADERYIPWLAGKLLNAADELSGANAIASDAFKAVVTGEPVTGRDVYRSAITFRSVALNIFCTNTLPSFTGGMDRGVQRRLAVLPFNRVIPKGERVERIGQLIGEQEPDLLLAFAVEGASRLIRQRDFTIPPSSEDALKQWLFTADPVIAWVEAEVTAIEPSSPEWRDAKMKSADAYSLFKRFAEEAGYHRDRLPAFNGFVQRLTAHRPTITVKHTNKGNWLTGIKVQGYEPGSVPRPGVGPVPEWG